MKKFVWANKKGFTSSKKEAVSFETMIQK